jgi:hypothetical protein
MFIPYPNFFHSGSRIPDQKISRIRILIENFSILTQKIVSKFSEHDPGCSSWIQILIFYPSRIPDPGVKKDTVSLIRNIGTGTV